MLTVLLTLSVSLIPISLLIILGTDKILSGYHPTIGKTTTIITAINGILTKDEFSVKTLVFDKYEADVNNENELIYLEEQNEKKEIRLQKKQLSKNPSIKLMAVTTTLCHYAKIHKIESLIGNFFKNCGISTAQIHRDYELITQIPSDKEKKISSIVAKKLDSKEIFSFSKGNPFSILEKCKRILINDVKLQITPAMRSKLKKKIKKLNQKGEKVIAFAYKGLPLKQLNYYSENFTENDLVLIGFTGLGDSLNENLVPAIEKIKNLGIKIYIVSQSKVRKALAVGKDLKIINSRYFEALTHEDLKDLSPEKLSKLLTNRDKDYIFAEIKESDRNYIIKALQQENQVITVTSPRNDLPHILKAVEKKIHNQINKEKLILHALSCKIAQTLLALAAVLTGAPPALTITAILALDLTLNLFLELSLRSEKTEEKGRNHKNHLLTNGISMGVILSSIYLWSLIRLGWSPGENLVENAEIIQGPSTMVFTLLATMQIINAHNLRHNKKSLFSNSLFLNLHLALTTILTIIIVYIFLSFPFFQEHLGLKQIEKFDWPVIFFLSALMIVIEEIRKFLIRKNEVSTDQSNSRE